MIKKLLVILFLTVSTNVYAVPEYGDKPYHFLGATVAGDKVNLDDYLGKVVVVSFWASWCAPCLQELPVLNAFQQQVGAEVMQVVAVNFKEDRKRYRKVEKVISEQLTSLTFTHDEKGRIGEKFGVKALPNLFIIDKNGKVMYHNVGFGDATIDKLITVLNKAIQQ